VLAPAGTPQPIIDKVRADVLAALRSPEFAGKLAAMSADVPNLSAAEFGTFIDSEYHRIGAIMKAVGLKAQ
jgi:tripartite-type tricarboxylate transporter receptor subunit TctC